MAAAVDALGAPVGQILAASSRSSHGPPALLSNIIRILDLRRRPRRSIQKRWVNDSCRHISFFNFSPRERPSCAPAFFCARSQSSEFCSARIRIEGHTLAHRAPPTLGRIGGYNDSGRRFARTPPTSLRHRVPSRARSQGSNAAPPRGYPPVWC
jgi:hypothetical protein